MTRKHYKIIADSIREAHTLATTFGEDITEAQKLFTNTLCRRLLADNPRFDSARFREYINR